MATRASADAWSSNIGLPKQVFFKRMLYRARCGNLGLNAAQDCSMKLVQHREVQYTQTHLQAHTDTSTHTLCCKGNSSNWISSSSRDNK